MKVETWPGCERAGVRDVVEISESKLMSLNYLELRTLAFGLGVLVQDEPGLDILRQRVRQCQEV